MGADWPLVQDALVIAALALCGGMGATLLFLKLRNRKVGETARPTAANRLEERVRVLERIATDSSIGLADEIESLRGQAREKEVS